MHKGMASCSIQQGYQLANKLEKELDGKYNEHGIIHNDIKGMWRLGNHDLSEMWNYQGKTKRIHKIYM